MNSSEEDALFLKYGWTKDLIARRWESPRGFRVGFDVIVSLTGTPEGEEALRAYVAGYGMRIGDD